MTIRYVKHPTPTENVVETVMISDKATLKSISTLVTLTTCNRPAYQQPNFFSLVFEQLPDHVVESDRFGENVRVITEFMNKFQNVRFELDSVIPKGGRSMDDNDQKHRLSFNITNGKLGDDLKVFGKAEIVIDQLSHVVRFHIRHLNGLKDEAKRIAAPLTSRLLVT